jgi:hypothetical protein
VTNFPTNISPEHLREHKRERERKSVRDDDEDSNTVEVVVF